MKSILYIGATLMVGASIYGFVDYQQTHHKKAFRDMYTEEKKAVASTPAETVPVKTEKTAPVSKAKPAAARKTDPVNGERPALTAPADELPSSANAIPDEKLKGPEPARETKLVKKKKIRKEFFSRGRMPEEEIMPDPVEKNSGKKSGKE